MLVTINFVNISITNMAAGMQATLDHSEVIATADAAKSKFQALILACLPHLVKH